MSGLQNVPLRIRSRAVNAYPMAPSAVPRAPCHTAPSISSHVWVSTGAIAPCLSLVPAPTGSFPADSSDSGQPAFLGFGFSLRGCHSESFLSGPWEEEVAASSSTR